ncbi:MAG: insulinase family protein [Betaproteobacteria bacterium]|nr:insulinase family protein [Betaproteobacteria bacterium]
MKRIFLTLIAAVVFFQAPGLNARSQDLRQWTTASGARVLFLSAPEIPMIDVAIDVDAGSRWDPSARAGLAAMVGAMLPRGIRVSGSMPAMSETQISEALAELAVQRGGSVTLDRASITLRTLSDADVRERAARLLSRVMFEPAFDQAILQREKSRTVAGLRESMTQPQSIATRALWRALYPVHPYGQQAAPETVDAIVVDDLVRFHQQHWQATRMRVTIVGALTEVQARAFAEQLLSAAPISPATAAAPQMHVPSRQHPAALNLRPAAVRQAIAHPASQSHLWLGLPGIARDDPDFFALTVGNYILGGGGFVSRLTEEIREKRGLSYSVFSAFQPLAQPGPFMMSLQTQKAKAPEALEVMEKTLKRFLQEGPTEKELKAAKQNLIGGFALRLDTNRKLLDNLAQINFYDMPLDYLDTWTLKVSRVTREDIRRAMGRVITAEQMSVIVVAGPEGFTP